MLSESCARPVRCALTGAGTDSVATPPGDRDGTLQWRQMGLAESRLARPPRHREKAASTCNRPTTRGRRSSAAARCCLGIVSGRPRPCRTPSPLRPDGASPHATWRSRAVSKSRSAIELSIVIETSVMYAPMPLRRHSGTPYSSCRICAVCAAARFHELPLPDACCHYPVIVGLDRLRCRASRRTGRQESHCRPDRGTRCVPDRTRRGRYRWSSQYRPARPGTLRISLTSVNSVERRPILPHDRG